MIDVQITIQGQGFLVAPTWDRIRDLPQNVNGTPPGAAVAFENEFTSNPGQRPDNDITVNLKVTGFAGGTVTLFRGGGAVHDEPRFTIDVVVPVLQLRVATPGAIPVAEPLPVSEPPPLAADSFQFQAQPPQNVTSSYEELTTFAAMPRVERRFFELRIVSRNVDGTLVEEDKIELTDENIGWQFENLSQLPELFRRLPDGRYRLYLHEDGTDRLVLDFIIEGGQPSEVPAQDHNNAAPAEDEPANQGQTGPNLQHDGSTTFANERVEPAETAGDLESGALATAAEKGRAGQPGVVMQSDSGDSEERPALATFAEQLGQAALFFYGGVVISAASLGLADRDDCEKSVDRAIGRFGRLRQNRHGVGH
jgi:hypothetical protein